MTGRCLAAGRASSPGQYAEVLLQEDTDLLTARFCSRAARDLAQQINDKKNQLRALLRAYNPALCQVFPGSKLHHPAVYALLQQYLFPDEFVQAGAEAMTTILDAHCRYAFGPARPSSSSTFAARPSPARSAESDPPTCTLSPMTSPLQQRKEFFLKTGYALIKDRQKPTAPSVNGAASATPWPWSVK